MIYDCFLYYDEDMLLDIRLNTLAAHVDKFVIVESTHTFTGKEKTLNFDINKFSAFRDKIIYVVYDDAPFYKAENPKEVDAWRNEAETRNAIVRGLTSARDDDLVLVADVDEIYNPQVLNSISPKALCTTIYMSFYNYQFNLQVFNNDGSPRLCKLPRATSVRNLKRFFGNKPEDLRNIKRSAVRQSFWRWNSFKLRNKVVQHGGWHFSWIMHPERIAEKMSSISHTEYDTPEFNNRDNIVRALTEGCDLWGRERKMVKQALTTQAFPAYLVGNRDKYTDFIL